eukprot:CAMPEP_0119035166 /NCGR_PEP_ID=MMETSP1177-20130426/2120_1 /TAXON_ID=2985 /ORGANISM="Ochromonas sp, Strain CCMP1899" /LENGTH=1167 /DNA_ID=CAMNT_0006993119 /DNA_START=471 /DNA_END=3971 /DNA_ORIENTATION=+
MKNMMTFGMEHKERVDILKNLTGRILHGKLTLVLGPPGSGKTQFLKALSGRIKTSSTQSIFGGPKFEGEVTYNGELASSGLFLLPKFIDYIEQKDSHAATLTVKETLEYAWMMSTGGHHSYATAKDVESAALLDEEDKTLRRVHNVLKVLGIDHVKDTIVGDAMIRGVSGGQKRRVTSGEMLVSPKPIKCMDCISNGLDTATTYDIIKATKSAAELQDTTFITALLQPPPEVFNLFDEIILMSEGQIIYHGPRDQVVQYFKGIGYDVPMFVDIADFLQELPTEEGARFINPSFKRAISSDNLLAGVEAASAGLRVKRSLVSPGFVPRGTEALVEAYKNSRVYAKMMAEMDAYDHTMHGFRSVGMSSNDIQENDMESNTTVLGSNSNDPPDMKKSVTTVASNGSRDSLAIQISKGNLHADEIDNEWPQYYRERFAGTWWFHFKYTLQRQVKLTLRDQIFIFARLAQCVLVGAIAGSLFSNIPAENTNSISGFLFYVILFNAFASFAMIPMCFDQKAVYYKQADSFFVPTSAFVLAQALVLYPLHIIETIIFGTIMYWAAGLPSDENGSRFLAFLLLCFTFAVACAQLFRLFAVIMPDVQTAFPLAGVGIILMVLFSGFIIPFSGISYGWVWFYYINPLSWALQAITINNFTSEKYGFLVCVDAACSSKIPFGIQYLQSKALPIDYNYVWYGLAVNWAEYFLLLWLTMLSMEYMRTEPSPPAPIIVPYVEEDKYEDDFTPYNPNTPINTGYSTGTKELVSGIGEESESKNDDSNHNIKMGEIYGSEKVQKINSTKSTVENGIRRVSAGSTASIYKKREIVQIPFLPVSFAFKDVSYSITLPNKEVLPLLQDVSGSFEPGSLTALMGSSGAGKTTLLDVLSGRKNTGVVSGSMYVNGKPKEELGFRRNMGYVEQFDSLCPRDTARESIEFSAALRLPRGTGAEERQIWVESVLVMLELTPLENTLVGSEMAGGMSFEQKKRVSIGVELAANPAILFLDEPTTGLDSRAAQVIIRNIKRVAASGRSIVCTIHQPSTVIFAAFDSLLLLKTGGQTVYFGNLGADCCHLINFFQSAPEVLPIQPLINPATWMLECIGAGTAATVSKTDYHDFYEASELFAVNNIHINKKCMPVLIAEDEDIETGKINNEVYNKLKGEVSSSGFSTSYVTQFMW